MNRTILKAIEYYTKNNKIDIVKQILNNITNDNCHRC